MPNLKSKNQPWWKRLLRFLVTRVLLLVVLAGLIYWQWNNITSWIHQTTVGVFQLFGFGLALVTLALMILIEFALVKPVWFLRYWNKWIGGIIFFTAVWGTLGFFKGSGILEEFTVGGRIGQDLVGGPDALGILIVLVMYLAAIFFFFPGGFARLIARCFGWIVDRFKRTPSMETGGIPAAAPPPPGAYQPQPTGEEKELRPTVFPKYKPPPKPLPVTPVNASNNWLQRHLHPQTDSSSSEPSSIATQDEPAGDVILPVNLPELETPTEETAVALAGEKETAETSKVDEDETASSKKDLKQAAQEVWKKYGESADQITADGWKIPPVEILDNVVEVEFNQADNQKKARLIEEALASYGVESKVVQINVGPTVTQFGIEPGWDRKLKEVREKDKNGETQIKTEEVAKTRVKVDRITSLQTTFLWPWQHPAYASKRRCRVNPWSVSKCPTQSLARSVCAAWWNPMFSRDCRPKPRWPWRWEKGLGVNQWSETLPKCLTC